MNSGRTLAHNSGCGARWSIRALSGALSFSEMIGVDRSAARLYKARKCLRSDAQYTRMYHCWVFIQRALNLNTFGVSPSILNDDHHINFSSTPARIPLVATPRVDYKTDSHFFTLSNSEVRVEIRANW